MATGGNALGALTTREGRFGGAIAHKMLDLIKAIIVGEKGNSSGVWAVVAGGKSAGTRWNGQWKS